MIRYLSRRMAYFVQKHDETTDVDVLAYGFDLWLQEILVILGSLLISIPFGLFFHVLISQITFNVIRNYAGGAHAKYRAVCIPLSIVMVFGPAFLTVKAGVLLPFWILPLLYLMNLLILFRYAPADTEIMPINDPDKKKCMKRRAIISLSIIFAISLIVDGILPDYACVMAITSTIVCWFAHPIAYAALGCKIKTTVGG